MYVYVCTHAHKQLSVCRQIQYLLLSVDISKYNCPNVAIKT